MRVVLLSLVLLLAPLASVPALAPASSLPGFSVYQAPAGLGANGGEPSIGVDLATGKVFVQALTETLRLTFDDAQSPASVAWANVAPHGLPNVDPILFTDRETGRTFAGGLVNDCSLLQYTDDDGASWTTMLLSCTAPAFDHEKIASGPWRGGQPVFAQYERAVYYCAQGVIQECAVSYDGGLTFQKPMLISTVCTSAVGAVKVAEDGRAYVPAKNCGSQQGVMVTSDNGLTWQTRFITGSTVSSGFNDPAVATTPSSWVYATWQGQDRNVRVALSKTQGQTWGPATDLTALAGLESGSFPVATAGDDDRAAVAFLGTATPGDAFARPFTGVWDLYVGYTYDAGATWTVVKATTDPVQRGWLCISGTTCDLGAAPTGRNLLDFIDVTTDADGRVLVAFADGCIGACLQPGATSAQSTSQVASVARQACGEGLLAAKGSVGDPCPTGAPPPPSPVTLSGAYYARGLLPQGNAEGLTQILLPSDTLTPAPPTALAPKVVSAGTANHGSNAGTIYDAHWAMKPNGAPLRLSASTVTAYLHVAGAGTLRVALYDAGPADFAAVATPLASVDVIVPAGATQVAAVFPPLTVDLQNGLELFVDVLGTNEVDILYDSASTPTRLEVS